MPFFQKNIKEIVTHGTGPDVTWSKRGKTEAVFGGIDKNKPVIEFSNAVAKVLRRQKGYTEVEAPVVKVEAPKQKKKKVSKKVSK